MNAADTAWMLVAAAMVLLMTPALAFFYGGLVRSKNALNAMMMSFISLGAVGVVWALIGYSLAFSSGNPFVGGLGNAALNGISLEPQGTIPQILFFAYQGTFAIITAALISGAIVERMRFGAYMVFITAWVIAIYAPVCHWVWGGGFLAADGALDFAGGTVVHVNAAAAAAVAAIVLKPRKDHGRQAILPHNVPFVLLGAGLLWFGWFGFNAGSALAANGAAALAFTNTMLAPAATLTAWAVLDIARSRQVTAVGAATGIVVGLVAITPAAGLVSPVSAILLGFIAAFPSYFAIVWRSKLPFDDSLDVVAAHGLGGAVGAILTGVFASTAWGSPADGALAGNPGQLVTQVVAVLATALYSAVGTFVLLKVIGLVMPLRAGISGEGRGLDVTEHGEEAYTDGEGAILVLPLEDKSSQKVVSLGSPALAMGGN